MRLLPLVLSLAAVPALAAEGMWTLDNLPGEAMQQAYGFTPDAAWTDKVMKASVRLAGGCSGSFVSPEGLVMTNAHCIVGCVQQLSSAGEDLVGNGFVAREPSQERVCPGVELNRLEGISDVTATVEEATAGKTGQAYVDARRAAHAQLQTACVGEDGDSVRCDIVELYQGGKHHLYRYRRYQDVRLVFSPEYEVGFFGGDPDNFNFPRYNLDMGLLRAYDDGRPAKVRHWFPFDVEGAREGELVMVTGHPGSTQRLLTVAQLESQRDLAVLTQLLRLAELRGLLLRFSAESPENARIARTDLTMVENSYKVYNGRIQALLDPAVFARKREEEEALRRWVAEDAGRRERYAGAWEAIEQAQGTYRDLYARYDLLETGRGFLSDHFTAARRLVRAAAEGAKPDGERLPEYAEAALPRLRQQLLAESPTYPEYEKMKLAWSLSKLRERLGADDPLVKAVLGRESPEAMAARLVDGTRLGDVAVRRALLEGGADAVAASDDPMIALAKSVDSASRAVRSRYESEVDSVVEASQARIARARFERHGTSVYPDATFSLRLSYGEIRGWQEGGRSVPPFTTIAGLFERATGEPPYRLPQRWLEARGELDLSARMNQVSTNDIIGGNSGSPLIDREARIVGLVFDGNIHSLGGAYGYDERLNRAVSVHPGVIVEALRKVYGATPLADEMLGE